MASHCRRREVATWVLFAWFCAASPQLRAQGVPPCVASSNGVRMVTGAPYSALGTSETVTTLPNGERVVRQNRIRQWRDSDGRTRSEITLSTIQGEPPVVVNSTVTVIDDPAARQRYMLQPGKDVAVTMPIVPCRSAANPPQLDPSVGPPRPVNLPIRVSPPVVLGERKLDGETVAGRRIEATIPAGAIGNTQPIRMSAEQWYGKDLQVVVEATYHDTRTGETRYRLSNIDRAEPDASLFKVPDTYRRFNRAAPPTRR